MSTKQSWLIPLMALVAAVLIMAAAACSGSVEETRVGEEAAPATESGTPANETVPEDIESAARKLLADELEVDEGGFRLDSSEEVEWPDASLGCPKEGYAYAQVITPGYKLVFKNADVSYAVHTNADGSQMVICKDGQ